MGPASLRYGIDDLLANAVKALDVAVEQLYFQADSLEAAHQALEIKRRSYQEPFEGGPAGYLVTDPEGMILRANWRAGELFACSAEDLVGELLPALVQEQHRPSLQAAIAAIELRDWDGEWIRSRGLRRRPAPLVGADRGRRPPRG